MQRVSHRYTGDKLRTSIGTGRNCPFEKRRLAVCHRKYCCTVTLHHDTVPWVDVLVKKEQNTQQPHMKGVRMTSQRLSNTVAAGVTPTPTMLGLGLRLGRL
uniref:Uncharacterized protein n=1 Tax=Eutreptiella gymnastica TaxID=73025 RepID=A0A7S1NME7_9EUGL